MRRAWTEVLVVVGLLEEEEERIIWAFCLITSAGVRTRHDASSAVPEAREWTAGVGRAVRRLE